jgi:hypothetical protein
LKSSKQKFLVPRVHSLILCEKKGKIQTTRDESRTCQDKLQVSRTNCFQLINVCQKLTLACVVFVVLTCQLLIKLISSYLFLLTSACFHINLRRRSICKHLDILCTRTKCYLSLYSYEVLLIWHPWMITNSMCIN